MIGQTLSGPRVPGLEREGQDLPQRNEVSCPWTQDRPQPPQISVDICYSVNDRFILQESKLRLEMVPDLPECHNEWVTNYQMATSPSTTPD